MQRSHRTPAAETSTRRLASRSQIEAGLPADLSATSCFIHGVEYLVLSHPIAPPAAPALEALSSAERDIALGLMSDLPYSEIAAGRGTSPRTVGKQAQALYRKLGIGSRSELVALCATRPAHPWAPSPIPARRGRP